MAKLRVHTNGVHSSCVERISFIVMFIPHALTLTEMTASSRLIADDGLSTVRRVHKETWEGAYKLYN